MFVVAGYCGVVIGTCRGWRWVNILFRLGHLAHPFWWWWPRLAGYCPAHWTTLEDVLRAQPANATYGGWFYRILVPATAYYDAPDWVFIAALQSFRDAGAWPVGGVYPPRWRRSA